jgi:lipoprotein signal peptidase
MSVTLTAAVPESRARAARLPWWIPMMGVATAGGIGDVALKLWAVSQLPYLRETHSLFGVGLLLVFNRTPSFSFEHVVIGQTLVVVIKFLALGYLGWRLKGWWRWLGLGLIIGGAMANVGNWLVTRAVVDFLVMPWATVNLADLLIVSGATVICAGWGARVINHLTRRTRPVTTRNPHNHDSHTISAGPVPLTGASLRCTPSGTIGRRFWFTPAGVHSWW